VQRFFGEMQERAMDMGGLAAIAAELARYYRAAVDAGARFAVQARPAVISAPPASSSLLMSSAPGSDTRV